MRKEQSFGLAAVLVMAGLIVALVLVPIPDQLMGARAPVMTPGVGVLLALISIGFWTVFAISGHTWDRTSKCLCMCAAYLFGFVALVPLILNLSVRL